MEFERRPGGPGRSTHDSSLDTGVPGKRTLTEQLGSPRPTTALAQHAGELLAEAQRTGSFEQVMTVVRHILELARRVEPDIAARLLEMLYVHHIPGIDAAIRDTIAAITRTFAHPTTTTTAPATTSSGTTTAPAATSSSTTVITPGFDWSKLIVHDKSGTHAAATMSAADQSQLAAIAAGRPAKIAAARAARGRHLNTRVAYQGVADAGWQYSNKASPGHYTPTGDKVLDAAATEIFLGGAKGTSIEATAGGIVTYDGTLSIGSGWANAAAADYVGRWLAKDAAARVLLLDAGFTITADHQFAVIDMSGSILIGDKARSYLRTEADGGILDFISGLIEDPAHNGLAMAAQTEKLKQDTVDALKEPIKTEIKTWKPEQIAAAIHLGHWLPQGGPVINPNDYTKTHGNPLMMIHAFAVNLHRYVQQPNGAFLLGNDALTAQPIDGHLDRFGDGLFVATLGSFAPIKMTFYDASTDRKYADHVLVVRGKVTPGAAGTHEFLDLGARMV